MRRRHNGYVPDGGRRKRKHRARNLHGSHREIRQRDLYRRLIDRVRLDLDPRAKEVLLALVDLRESGPTLRDVSVTQQQIVDLLAGAAGEPRWGWSLTAVRRLIRLLVDDGWLSIEDIDLPSGGWQMNCYRFHVPNPYLAIWRLLGEQAEGARQNRLEASKTATSAHQGPPAPDGRPRGSQPPRLDRCDGPGRKGSPQQRPSSGPGSDRCCSSPAPRIPAPSRPLTATETDAKPSPRRFTVYRHQPASILKPASTRPHVGRIVASGPGPTTDVNNSANLPSARWANLPPLCPTS